jgi:hypothetical protein
VGVLYVRRWPGAFIVVLDGGFADCLLERSTDDAAMRPSGTYHLRAAHPPRLIISPSAPEAILLPSPQLATWTGIAQG